MVVVTGVRLRRERLHQHTRMLKSVPGSCEPQLVSMTSSVKLAAIVLDIYPQLENDILSSG